MDRIRFVVAGQEIEIKDTPKIVDLLRSDDEFTFDFFRKAIKENKLMLDGVIEDDIDETDIKRCSDEDDKSSKCMNEDVATHSEFIVSQNASIKDETNSFWTREATKLLLTLYKDFLPKTGKSVKVKNKRCMWKCISDEMAKSNYNFTALQVENRYKTLNRGFMKKTINNKKNRRDRASYSFEKELLEINKNENHLQTKDMVTSAASTNSRRCDILQSSRMFKTILEELRTMQERNGDGSKEEIGNERNILKRKALELEEAKLDAYKKRTEAINRQTSVLEDILRKVID